MFPEVGRFILSLWPLPQLSRHAVLGDGERGLGSHEVVAGVMAMSAHLTQDAGRAHAGRDIEKHQYRHSASCTETTEHETQVAEQTKGRQARCDPHHTRRYKAGKIMEGWTKAELLANY